MWMMEDIIHTLTDNLPIAVITTSITGLQTQVGIARYAAIAFWIVCAIEHHLDFVYLFQGEWRHVLGEEILGRPRHPVNGCWKRMRPVGFYGDIEACLMECFNQCIVCL